MTLPKAGNRPIVKSRERTKEEFTKFAADQERDENGRFATGGGGLPSKIADAIDKMPKAPGYEENQAALARGEELYTADPGDSSAPFTTYSDGLPPPVGFRSWQYTSYGGGGMRMMGDTPDVQRGDVVQTHHDGYQAPATLLLVTDVDDNIKNDSSGFMGIKVNSDGSPFVSEWGQLDQRWAYTEQAEATWRKR
jgi:hypothetical protein